MILKNQDIEGQITNWGPKGHGILSYQGFPIHIPHTAIGDFVRVKVLKILPHMAYGKVLSILEASPERIHSLCPIHHSCGACQFQHISYDAELSYKKTTLTTLLTTIGVQNMSIGLHPMKNPYAYRNRAQYSIRQIQGVIQIGLSASRSQRLVDIPNCAIQTELSNRIINALRATLNSGNYPIYSPESPGLSGLVLRVNHDNSQALLTLVCNSDNYNFGSFKDLQAIPELKGVVLNNNPNPEWVNLGSDNRCLWGDDFIMESIHGIEVPIKASSFFQVNVEQTKVLWQCIQENLPQKNDAIIWDLYCGAAALSMYLAKKYSRITGIDSSEEMIKSARFYSKKNNTENLNLVAASVDELIDTLQELPDAIIVDPPRKGLELKVIQSLIQKKVPNIVYVSCVPEVLCRDLRIFLSAGYKINKIDLVDLFPRTHHMEVVVGLVIP
jgi:23S rRNA (uracil1939-C5)-methyltransferase